MTLDCIIHGGCVVTMEGPGTGVIPRGAVGIKAQKDCGCRGRRGSIKPLYGSPLYSGKGKGSTARFVNVHMHTGDAIVRSCAQDIPGENLAV